MTAALASVRRRAESHATNELVQLASGLRAFAVQLVAASGDETKVLECTLMFARAVEERLTSAFIIGHAAGYIDQERPAWRR